MAWIYLAESEESLLPWHHGSDLSPIVKTTDTLKAFYCHGCGAENYRPPEFGTTSPRSYLSCCPETRLTSYMADSPVRTSALLAAESAWAESEADYFSTSQGLSKKQTRDMYFSKTCRQLELVASTVSSKHLPNSGMTVDGQLYRPPKLEPRTFENAGSYWPTPRTMGLDGGSHSMAAAKARGMWPTPHANCHTGTGHGPNKKGAPNLQTLIGGKLNPQWVEWLMGYPHEWTALEPWATQWFRSRRGSRSKD
jgi:hypothetical protein